MHRLDFMTFEPASSVLTDYQQNGARPFWLPTNHPGEGRQTRVKCSSTPYHYRRVLEGAGGGERRWRRRA